MFSQFRENEEEGMTEAAMKDLLEDLLIVSTILAPLVMGDTV